MSSEMVTDTSKERSRKHYSRDIKDLVIYQHSSLNLSSSEIARYCNMPLRVVQRVLKTWEEIGMSAKDPQTLLKPGRTSLLGPEQVDYLVALIHRYPDLYLDEIAELLFEQHNISVSLSTVQRSLKLIGLGSKKLSKVAAERCETRRAAFQFQISQERPEWLVFTDESAVNMLTAQRTHGRGFKGQRVQVKEKFQRGQRFSILPALTISGYLYSNVVSGSFSGDTFLSFLEHLLEYMTPYPGPRSVLVMDNCAIHHVEGVTEMCEARGVKLYYLPPYSPDFNPIEESFSWMKAYLRRHNTEFHAAVEAGGTDAAMLFLYDVLEKVTGNLAAGWFRDCGYF